MARFEESGLVFGDFADTDVFKIESSEFIRQVEGVKACEFVWYESAKKILWFIEAKSTIPKENDAYFTEIFEKLENSLVVTAMGIIGKNSSVKTELSDALKCINWREIKFKLVLVVPPVPNEYLQPLSDKLRAKFLRQSKTWGIKSSNIAVINEGMAQQAGLLVSD